MTVLIVEDDTSIARSLADYLGSNGLDTLWVSGESDAVSRLSRGGIDLALVDISISDGTGFGVCAAAKDLGIPVIFLTASGDESSVVRGLDMGADDYIAKPFRPRELISRIKSVLRRSGPGQSVFAVGSIRVDTDRGVVSRSGRDISLSALEYKLLMTFVNNRGKLLSRDALLDELWDAGGDYVNDNTLTVYIKRLREKIEDDPACPVIIQTVRGLGYRMD